MITYIVISCFKSNVCILTRRVTIVEQELPTLPEHPIFSGVRIAKYLVFCVVFCRSLFVLLSFFLCSLCCLSFFDLRILITPLVPFSLHIKDTLLRVVVDDPLEGFLNFWHVTHSNATFSHIRFVHNFLCL